jgi:hypothetical protein
MPADAHRLPPSHPLWIIVAEKSMSINPYWIFKMYLEMCHTCRIIQIVNYFGETFAVGNYVSKEEYDLSVLLTASLDEADEEQCPHCKHSHEDIFSHMKEHDFVEPTDNNYWLQPVGTCDDAPADHDAVREWN